MKNFIRVLISVILLLITVMLFLSGILLFKNTEIEKLLYLGVLLIVLAIIEIVCICSFTGYIIDEKDRKFTIFETITFKKNPEGKQIIEDKEIYKIFCNTLVDL